MMGRYLGVALALAAAALLPVSAAAQARCSQELLTVQATPVTIGYCVEGTPRATASGEILVPIQATYSAPGGSFGRTKELHFIAGEGASRVLESLALKRLGLRGTLHLTLLYAGGLVRIEGALLTPGAITIK